MENTTGKGWLVLQRRAHQVVRIQVPGRERPIEVAVSAHDRGVYQLSIRADRDIEIQREERDNNETHED